MKTILRIFAILKIFRQYNLFEYFRKEKPSIKLRFLFWIFLSKKCSDQPYADRLHQALLRLGPIFVKFGQILSTRRDMMPEEIADKLALLQDSVPSMPHQELINLLKQNYGDRFDEIFSEFGYQPVASASIAQVHRAVLRDGPVVAVKMTKPFLREHIECDIQVLKFLAQVAHTLHANSRRLKIIEVVDEFSCILHKELDLMNEAASCAQFKRLFRQSKLLLIPEIYWSYCTKTIIVMDWVDGICIKNKKELIENRIDLRKLAATGVEIFFTQVFRDGFFHADMHPGNIFILRDGRYAAVDFGIVGTLSEKDKNYLADNFLAFFNRDYRRVALAHIEAGWAPADTRVDQFEMAIRTVCEPIFNRPLKDISFGQLLAKFFETAREFNVVIQPQLFLLQKTIFNIEGLGRELDPYLDLWITGKPLLEQWVSEQIGIRSLWANLKKESLFWPKILPQLPRLLDHCLRVVGSNSTPSATTNARDNEEKQKWTSIGKKIDLSLMIGIFNLMVILYLFIKK